MPPRLLDDTTAFGACAGQVHCDHHYGLEDTIAVHGGLWSFGKGAVSAVSNQYAAMPSLHCGWSTWCAIAFFVCFRKRWWRWLGVLYPLSTIFCILVTANHYWIDAVGGWAVLLAGWLIAVIGERLRRRWAQRGLGAQTAAPSTSATLS
jgi:membrane-associated phospholipid phosphatase